MIIDQEKINEMAIKYNLPIVDVLLIALNCSGLSGETIIDNRVRFKLKVGDSLDTFFLALCVNTTPTAFTINDNQLLLADQAVGQVISLENDTCTESYFRRGKSALTLNSNSRSECVGCKFCGTYNLSSNDKQSLTNESYLKEYLQSIKKNNKLEDFSALEEVAVCTGCFPSENDLVMHLLTLNKVLSEFNFTGEIKYIGSQLVSLDKIQLLKNSISKFALYFTVECFTRRTELLRPEKRLDLEKIKSILNEAKNLGVATSIIYILGLEELTDVAQGLSLFKDCLTRFPVINVMQNYLSEQESLKVEDAKDLDYYLQARQLIEKIYNDSGLKPQLWEGYRNLWYSTYNGAPLEGIKI